MSTSGISVNNYSSYNPKSRCNILARISENASRTIAKSKINDAINIGAPTHSATDESITISGADYISSSLSITAQKKIRKITVYGLAGNQIGTFNGQDSSIEIPLSALNITRPGIYIVSVNTANGTASKKIIIR